MNDKVIKYRNAEGKFHRTDGPAIEFADGTKSWFVEGRLHRTDGPAVKHANGSEYWYIDDRLHRTDGPAIEYADGDKHWFIYGTEYSLEEYIDLVSEEIQIDIVLNHLPGFKTNE